MAREQENPIMLAGRLVRGDATRGDCVGAAKAIRDLSSQVRDHTRRTDSLAFEIAYAIRENIEVIDAEAGQYGQQMQRPEDEANLWYQRVTELIKGVIGRHDDKWGRLQ